MDKKAVLIFGVGELQQSIIKRAKVMGLFVVGIDPCEDAYAKGECDAFEVVGGQDYEGTLAVAKKYNVSAIVTAATDKPLVMMARIAKSLRLPFFSEETAIWSTDKYQMKQRFLEGGIPCAKGVLLSVEDLLDIIRSAPVSKHQQPTDNCQRQIMVEGQELRFPVICKPRDNSGSRGVKLCQDIYELQECVEEALLYSKLNTVLVEEFIVGQEFSIESLHYDGKSEVIQFTEKKTTEFPYNVELEHKQPANLSEEYCDVIRNIVGKIGKTLHFENCPSHTELKINERGIFVIETSPRLGGDYITSMLTPISSGINIEDQLLHIAFGEKVDTITGRVNNAAGICFFSYPEGQVKSIAPEISSIASLPHIHRFELKLREGDCINKITSSLNRYGQFIVEGETRKEVDELMEKYQEKINSNIIIA